MPLTDSLRDDLLAAVPSLRAFAISLSGNGDRADDLVQDTLERALSRLHLWQSGTDMRRWLFTIMHNLHVNQVRRAIRRGSEAAIEDVEDRLVQNASQTDSVVVRDLNRAMQELPSEQVEVLVLVDVDVEVVAFQLPEDVAELGHRLRARP